MQSSADLSHLVMVGEEKVAGIEEAEYEFKQEKQPIIKRVEVHKDGSIHEMDAHDISLFQQELKLTITCLPLEKGQIPENKISWNTVDAVLLIYPIDGSRFIIGKRVNRYENDLRNNFQRISELCGDSNKLVWTILKRGETKFKSDFYSELIPKTEKLLANKLAKTVPDVKTAIATARSTDDLTLRNKIVTQWIGLGNDLTDPAWETLRQDSLRILLNSIYSVPMFAKDNLTKLRTAQTWPLFNRHRGSVESYIEGRLGSYLSSFFVKPTSSVGAIEAKIQEIQSGKSDDLKLEAEIKKIQEKSSDVLDPDSDFETKSSDSDNEASDDEKDESHSIKKLMGW